MEVRIWEKWGWRCLGMEIDFSIGGHMRNYEKFIKKWEKTWKKGKFKFIMSSILTFSVLYWVIMIGVDLARGYGLTRLTGYLPSYIAGFIGYTAGLIANWNRNESKYSRLR